MERSVDGHERLIFFLLLLVAGVCGYECGFRFEEERKMLGGDGTMVFIAIASIVNHDSDCM